MAVWFAGVLRDAFALTAAGGGFAEFAELAVDGLRGLLRGLRDCFEALLDVRGPRAWKPAPAAYRYAVDQPGVPVEEALLVAVHSWDIDGARRAGLGGAWPRRGAVVYPAAMMPGMFAQRAWKD